MRRRIMNYLLAILAIYALLCLFLVWNESRMIYYPTHDIAFTPDHYEDLTLTSSDGVNINAWYIPAPRSQNAATVLFLHGNAGNITHRSEKLAILHDLGVNVLILDYRGYGKSEGKPNETGTYLDAEAAYSFLLSTVHCPPNTVLLYGESLGSAIAVELATRHHVAGVIIEEPFTSVADVGKKMFPFLPVRWLVRNKYDTLSKIARINSPLLIFHSRDDEIFPYRHAERLLAAAQEPKKLIELRGGHNDAFLQSADIYRQGLREFLSHVSQ